MIAELVTFPLAQHMEREAVMEDARTVIDHWRGNDQLIRKHFLIGEDGSIRGLYFWKSRAAAEAAHDEAWKNQAEVRLGVRPTIEYFDMLMVLDNVMGTVTENP